MKNLNRLFKFYFILSPFLFVKPFLIGTLPKKIDRPVFFYISIMLISLVHLILSPFNNENQWLIFVNIIIWLFLFLAALSIKRYANYIKYKDVVFIFYSSIFVTLCIFFYWVAYYKTLNIFAQNSLIGDFLGGYSGHSRVQMIAFSFFSVIFLSRKEWGKFFIANIFMLITTFMSGLFLYYIILITVLIFINSPQKSMKYLVLVSGVILIFSFVLENNFSYLFKQLYAIFSLNPPRKIVSFIQTYEYFKSDFVHTLFGAGPGHFSSRLAFIVGGEYISGFPSSLVYRSSEFFNNHFQLWNAYTLSIPFNDGTANQPFSVYNQIVGEYGIIGTFCFIYFYILGFTKFIRTNKYKLFLILLLLSYFILEYWFEYFSIVFLFEVLMRNETIYIREKA